MDHSSQSTPPQQQLHPSNGFPQSERPSNPNPNPNPNVSPDPNSAPVAYPNLMPNSFSIPTKRRRGRPRNAPSSSLNQLQYLPPFLGAATSRNPNLPPSSQLYDPSAVMSNFSASNPSPDFRSTAQALPDVADEIIVINENATNEAMTALTAGFPADVLTDEEIEAGVVSVVGGIEQVNYILIRNHIIFNWRENTSNWVTKEMFVDVVPTHCSSLLDSAYNYLVSHGYINFGVAPAIKERIPSEPSKPSVIVIGAGLAGLAAARQLMLFGFKVVVLEGRKRAGGRVYTMKMEGGNKSAAADLGGSVLTGCRGNPLAILAGQLSYELHKVRDMCPLYRADGKSVDTDLDKKVETTFNRLLDRASKLRQMMGGVSQDVSLGAALETFWQVNGNAFNEEEMSVYHWHLANLEFANAGLLSKLSLAFWDQDDVYDFGGDHCFLHGGNGKLIQALAENVPILYEKTVNTIRYDGGGVQVFAGSQVFEGDMALCTVPLGVLKSGSIRFIPELPQRKLDSIKRLGFGLLNKVAMLFPHAFWGTDLDSFGHVNNDPIQRGEFFLFYSYSTVAGGPLLIALVAGEAAHKFEGMPPTDAVTLVLQILRGIYEPQGIQVPEPIQTVCTRWGGDPFCFGSYSNVAVGASGDDYDILAESVGDGRLFFAGEATTRRYPATMHGAFITGLREAANMDHYAKVRASRLKVEKNPSKDAHSCASLLVDLFREPDLEFGSFSVLFGRNTSESLALLRVTIRGPQRKSHDVMKSDQQHSNKLLFRQLQSHFSEQQELHVFTLLSKDQALQLREVRGGDEMRMNYLSEKLGLKLVGRKGLGPNADSVIASIKAERGNRRLGSTSAALESGISKLKAPCIKPKLVRKAKIVGKSSDTAPAVDGGVKFVDYGISSNLLNVNLETKQVGNSNGATPPSKSFGATTSSNNNGFSLSPNSGVGAKYSSNSSVSASLNLNKAEKVESRSSDSILPTNTDEDSMCRFGLPL